MKTIVVIGLTALAVALGAQSVQMKVEAQGYPAGTATVTQKILPDGSKQNSLKMNLKPASGASVTVRIESTYDAKGAPIRTFQEMIVSQPASRRSVTVTYNAKGARAVTDEGGARTVKDVPLVDSAPRQSASEFWFLRHQPKPGEKDVRYHFNANSLEWTLIETTYVGVRTVNLNGKKVKVHVCTGTSGEAWFDEKGLPLRVSGANFVMTRS